MTRYDSNDDECFVFTFKEGLLSPIAHDLRLRVGHFSLEVDDATSAVVASFDASSLSVDAPMKEGAANPTALSTADKQKIADQIREDVLHSARYPQIAFRGRVSRARADGFATGAGAGAGGGVGFVAAFETAFAKKQSK